MPEATHETIMGTVFSSHNIRVLIAGLDSAGKTTVLYKLKGGPHKLTQPVRTIPTMDFNTEEWKFKGKTFSVWDVGGQDSIRPLWRHHLTGTQGVVYVVDSNDRQRVRKAAQELHKIMLDHSMRNACLLVFAKQVRFATFAVGRRVPSSPSPRGSDGQTASARRARTASPRGARLHPP